MKLLTARREEGIHYFEEELANVVLLWILGLRAKVEGSGRERSGIAS